MVRNWIRILNVKAAEWGVPAAVVSGLIALYQAAKDTLEVILDKETRTPVAIMAFRTAFKALVLEMRSIKRHYFQIPPLTPADFTALGFDQPDQIRTTIEAPTAVPQIVVENTLIHFQHKIRVFNPLNGRVSKPAGVHGMSYAWQIGGEKPASGEDLPRSRFNRKTTMVFTYTEREKGKSVYYAVCYENDSGDQGHWSQIEEAIIG
jgi:hypothetical protein